MSEAPKTGPEKKVVKSSKVVPLESSRITGKKKGRSDKIYFDAILFDLDGTLIDSSADIGLAANHVREQMKMPPLDIEKIKTFIGDGVRMLLVRALETEDPAILGLAMPIWETYYRKNCLVHTKPYSGIKELLTELYSDRVPMAVVSNKPVGFCDQILQGLKLKKYFPSIIGGDSAPTRKPEPEPMLLAAQQLGIESKSILVVGDSANDIISAQKAGFKSCGILWGIGLEKSIREAGPHYVIHMPSDIPRLIRTVVIQ